MGFETALRTVPTANLGPCQHTAASRRQAPRGDKPSHHLCRSCALGGTTNPGAGGRPSPHRDAPLARAALGTAWQPAPDPAPPASAETRVADGHRRLPPRAAHKGAPRAAAAAAAGARVAAGVLRAPVRRPPLPGRSEPGGGNSAATGAGPRRGAARRGGSERPR